MKLDKLNQFIFPKNLKETMEIIGDRWLKNPLATVLFLSLSLNIIIAPAVMAATDATITRQTAYAIGILYCVTVALSVYLFTVIFQPERF